MCDERCVNAASGGTFGQVPASSVMVDQQRSSAPIQPFADLFFDLSICPLVLTFRRRAGIVDGDYVDLRNDPFYE